MKEREILQIDLGYLRELSGGNTDFEREMLALFNSEVAMDVAAIETALKENDCQAIGYIAHKLKSSIQLVGFGSLFDLLSEIEEIKSRQSVTDTEKKHIHYITDVLKSSFVQIEEKLKS